MTRRLRFGQLVPYKRNPRKNDAAVTRMVASLTEFGFKIPMLVRTDGEIVDGHLRLKAALKLGMTEVPIIRCDEWSAAQVKAFRLLVNRSATWAEWDEGLLAIEFGELAELNFDPTLTGFDPREIDTFMAAYGSADDAQADSVPELPDNPACARATFGSVVHTECFAVIPPARTMWRGSWASANRF